MIAAMAADVEIVLQLAPEQHRVAAGAFLPQIVGDFLLRPDQRADFGADEIGEPVHGSILAIMRRFCHIGDEAEHILD
jgi:hypothetical protein